MSETMTVEGRAKAIWNNISGRSGAGLESWEEEFKYECLAFIQAQITQACEAARESERARCVKIHHTAMSVWCATQFPEECSEKDRAEAHALKHAHGGTLGFITDSEAEMRALANPPAPKETV